jgi:hypothetical protein
MSAHDYHVATLMSVYERRYVGWRS